MRLVYVVLDQIPANYVLVLSNEEADLWEADSRFRFRLRRALKRRAIQVSCPVISIYRMTTLLECWKIRSVDW